MRVGPSFRTSPLHIRRIFGDPLREPNMIEVKLDEGDRLEWALKAFKKKVLKSGILKELRRKRHYVKPSEARQLKSAAARRRARQKPRPPR